MAKTPQVEALPGMTPLGIRPAKVANAWGMTEEEYQVALKHQPTTSQENWDFRQLRRFYIGKTFGRDAAARALLIIRHGSKS